MNEDSKDCDIYASSIIDSCCWWSSAPSTCMVTSSKCIETSSLVYFVACLYLHVLLSFAGLSSSPTSHTSETNTWFRPREKASHGQRPHWEDVPGKTRSLKNCITLYYSTTVIVSYQYLRCQAKPSSWSGNLQSCMYSG